VSQLKKKKSLLVPRAEMAFCCPLFPYLKLDTLANFMPPVGLAQFQNPQ
jgi:hypothetical protein